MSNINDEQHLLTCQVELKGLSKAITEMIIPTGLDFSEKSNTNSTNTTAVLENGFLMVKVVFSETNEYTSMLVRINIVFN